MSFLRRFQQTVMMVSLLLLATNAHAAATKAKSFYLYKENLPPTLLLPPPDETDSAGQDQMKQVLTAQQHASKSDIVAMKDEQNMRLDLMTSVIGPEFTRQKYPKTYMLLDHALSDTQVIVENDKAYWHTRRPYLVDNRVKLMIDPLDNSPSYPSGHACESRMLAEILGQLFPKKIWALRARAEAIGDHRVEAGVHYPFDLRGGRALALLITGALMQDEMFQDDLDDAKQEIAKAP